MTPDRSRALLLAGAKWCLCAASLAILYGPPLRSHFELASRPGVLNDDARALVYPYYRFDGASQFATDEAASFMLAVTPAGVRALQSTLAAWVDPVAFTTVAAYGLLLVTIVACAAAAWRLGGTTSAWAAVVLLLGSGHALSRMADTLPRAWSFPVLALSMLALVEGHPLVLAGLVVAGALLYPASGVVAGLALAILLLLVPARHRGRAAEWMLRRRLAVLAATIFLAALAWLPVALRSQRYGPLIVPSQFATFPEAGPDGRLSTRDDHPRGRGFTVELHHATERSVSGSGPPLVPALHDWYERHERGRWIAILGLAVAGAIVLASHRPETLRAAVLPAAALALYFIAGRVFPYLYFPERFLGYPLPVALAVLLPATIRALTEEAADTIGRSRLPARARAWLGTAAVLGLIACVGGRSTGDEGLTVRVDPEAPIYSAIAALPTDALIAGWPRGVIDDIPYLLRRRVLVSYETHQPQYAGYVLTMRRRAQALFAAYFATTPEPILELRDRHGVTHLLIDLDKLERPRRYFAPFDEDIERAVSAAKGKGFEVLRQAPRAAVYRDSRHLLLDLSRI